MKMAIPLFGGGEGMGVSEELSGNLGGRSASFKLCRKQGGEGAVAPLD